MSTQIRLWALPLLFVLHGCREKPEVPRPAAATSSRSEKSSAASPLQAANGDDQESFPRSPKDGPWIKGEPVQNFGLADLDKVIPADEAARLSFFRISSVARGRYQLPHSSAVPIATVVQINTESPDDAYGILTCRSDAAELFRIGGETRVQRGDGMTLHCWQGKSYISAHIPQADAESTEELIRLMTFVAGKTKKEPLPSLLDAIPRDTSAPGRHWLVRNLASLPAEVLAEVGPFDRLRTSEILGLDRDSIMCVATYVASGTARPNAVWVVRYSSVRSAHDAFKRYQRHLSENPNDSVAQSTNVLPAQGMFLLGTWTAEEESMQYILPRIRQLLPS